MARASFDELLEAGVHFGHMKRKWNPSMAPYIFMEKNGIHIIDLHKTSAKIDEAANVVKQIAKQGKKILFVATKKQAKEIVAQKAKSVGMPYVTERWPGGMLTNFVTIRKAVKKMSQIDKMGHDGTLGTLSKKERLQVSRQRAKLEKNLGSIADLTRLPAAVFIVDVLKEHIAVHEAKKLNIMTFAIVDTNSNPNTVDYAIPANDDASKSIEKIIDLMVRAIQEGLDERKTEKDKPVAEKEEGEEIVEKTKKFEIDEEEVIEAVVVGKETKTAKKVVPMKKATDKDEKVSTPRKRITPKK
jgi:small subunit ribosomal protein S2